MLNIRLSSSLIILFQLQILHLSSPTSAIRLDVSLQEKQICRTTVQGRYLLSDDNGYVCDALSLDTRSRCCRGQGEQYSCHGCNLESHCCNSYEFCVSCCLSPARTHKDLALKVKIAKPVTAGTYSSVFDFCAGRCRHNSESVHSAVKKYHRLWREKYEILCCGTLTPFGLAGDSTHEYLVHENAYFSDFHHCFALPSNISGVTNTHSEVRLGGINVIVGKQGESCDTVCKSNGQSCVPSKLVLLNQCEIMQKYMSCRGACLASIGADQPAEVVDDAPRYLNPGACLYTKQHSILSCDGSHKHTRRLCPCA